MDPATWMQALVPSAAGAGPPAGLPGGDQLDIGGGRRAFVRTTRAAGGLPVLLLHGLGATGALNWAPCFEPLARRGQVIAIDHRGHGRGPRVGHRFTLAGCADDAAAVLRALVPRPAIVVGYSMGGPIAQLLAQRHPELVAGLVLSATARDFRGRPAERLRFAALGALAASRLPPPWPRFPPVPLLPGPLGPVGWALSELRRHEPAAVLGAAAALGRFTSREWVHRIDVPTAVIVHGQDRLVPPRRQRRLREAVPGATGIEVAIGHAAVGRDADRYVPALLRAHDSLTDRTARRAA